MGIFTPHARKLYKAYSEGLVGCLPDPALRDRLVEDGTIVRCSDLPTNTIKGLHKTMDRVLLFKALTKLDPKVGKRNQGAYASEAQTEPDCTSHGCRNAFDTTRAVEQVIQGEAQQFVVRSSTEYIYAGRGFSGGGMSPEKATKIISRGTLLRKDYRSQGGPDLRKYDGKIGARLGGSGIPPAWESIAETELHAGKWLYPQTIEDCLDALAAGFGAHAGSQFGSSDNLGADGLNRKTTSWNHDMGLVGYDKSKEFWRVEVVFVPNSWGAWNNPNPVWLKHQDVLGPWIPGMLVVPIEEYERHVVRAGSLYHFSHVEGDAIKALPLETWGASDWSVAA